METPFRVLEIGTTPQLLIDDYVVEDVWMIRRSPEEPVKHLGNPIFPAGDTVIYDDEEKLFKMWYGIGIPGTFEAKGAYAVSSDGLHWEKPELGLVEADGSTRNNLIETTGFGSVLKDPHDPDPARRYKMMTKRAGTPESEGRAFAAFSPDGIHWKDHPGEKSILRASNDGNGMVLRDDSTGKYINFRRTTVLAGGRGVLPEDIGFPDPRVMKGAGGDRLGVPEGIGFPSEDDFESYEEAEEYIHRYLRPAPYVHTRTLRIFRDTHEGLGCNRRIARSESDDFLHWTEPEVIIRPDELDPPRLYSISVARYLGMYIGLLELYDSCGNRRAPGTPQESDTIDTQLVFSRDGWKWERLANRPVFLRRGIIGAFDCGMLRPVNPPFVVLGDEIRIYYYGHGSSHNIPSPNQGLGVARLPKERFVARVAGDEVGALITKPFRLEGGELQINANAAKGMIKVEVTDPFGNPLEGFSAKEAVEIRENGFRVPMQWTCGKRLSEIAGRAVRLRFYLYRSRLYSFVVDEGR